jgi:hypothetical protein
MKELVPTTASASTATAAMAGAGLGYIITVVLELSGFSLSADQGAGLSTAGASIFSFIWHKILKDRM